MSHPAGAPHAVLLAIRDIARGDSPDISGLSAPWPATLAPALTAANGRRVDLLGGAVGDEILRQALEVEDELAPQATEWPAPPAEEAFSGLAGDIIRAIEPHSESDPVALLLQFLIAFGNCVGRRPHAEVEADWHTGNLFGVLVGKSAKGRKGTSWGHIRRVMEAVDGEWAGRRVASGLSSGEGLIWAVRDPIERIKTSKDGEVSTFLEDAGEPDKRLLAYEPEFASLLRVMERDGNTLSAVVREAWDTGSLGTLTKNCPNRATGAHVSVIGHVTKDELLRYLTKTESANGFANRFLLVMVRRSKELPFGGRVAESDMAPLKSRLHRVVEAARDRGALAMDEAARGLWVQAYHDLSADRPGMFGSITGRAEAQTLRLSLLYALLDADDVIRDRHLRAALALWAYCEESCRYIFGCDLGDPVADEILRALRTRGTNGMTRNDIREHFGRNRDSQQIGRALALLQEHGLATMTTEATGGRPLERWVSRYAVSAKNAKSLPSQGDTAYSALTAYPVETPEPPTSPPPADDLEEVRL